MSAIARIKAQIRAQQNVARTGGEQKTMNPLFNQGNETIVLPEKPKKKRKILEVQKEHKETLKRMPSTGGGGNSKKKEDEIDDEENEEDDDADMNMKPRHVPWGPSELLSHLDKPEVSTNINRVIQLVKQKEIETPITDEERKKTGTTEKNKKEIVVWDHSSTPLGKESDNNFFLWLEAYSAHEDKICQEQENSMFD